MHLLIELDQTTTINTDAQETTWDCLYVRLLDQPLWLAPGDSLDVCTAVDASTDSPCYHVDVYHHPRDASPVHVAEYGWSSDGSTSHSRR